MKHTVKRTVLVLASLACLPFAVMAANPWLQQEKAKLPPAASIGISMLEICAKDKLGGDEGIQRTVEMGRQAERLVKAACRQNDLVKARKIVTYYSKTDEAKVVLECLQELRPIIEDPTVQKLIPNMGKARLILAGGIPEDVCHP